MPQWSRGAEYFRSKVVRTILPPRIAAAAQRHFIMSFRNQGFTDTGLRRWVPTKGAKAGRTLKRTQALANSIRIAEATFRRIEVTAGNQYVRYAQIHNEGGWIRGQKTVRAHVRGPFKRRRAGRTETVKRHAVRRHQARVNMYIRQRRFMGPSATLNLEIARIIDAGITEARKAIFNT